jgi:phosphonate transport system permease protein
MKKSKKNKSDKDLIGKNKSVLKEKKEDVFKQRNKQFLITFIIIGLLTAGSSIITEFSFLDGFSSFPKAFGWMFTNFIPDQKALSILPNILKKLFDTIMISIAATIVAAFLAMILALIGSKTTGSNFAVSSLVRLIASFFRNIPIAAWAMIFMFSFGHSMVTGFLAIFVETFGFLIRTFMESIDETSSSPVEALNAAGATHIQTVFQAVFPSVMPQVVSWILYMIETNIRSATLVGLLTGSGIGFLFDMYYKRMYYPSAAMVVLSIVLAVLLIEFISNNIRRIIL